MKQFYFRLSLVNVFNVGERIRLIYDALFVDKMFERGDEGVVTAVGGRDSSFVEVEFDCDKGQKYVLNAFVHLQKTTEPKDEFIFLKSYPDVAETSVNFYYNKKTRQVKCVHDSQSMGAGEHTDVLDIGDFEETCGDTHEEILNMIYDLDPELQNNWD